MTTLHANKMLHELQPNDEYVYRLVISHPIGCENLEYFFKSEEDRIKFTREMEKLGWSSKESE